jgi:pimeloyl-ACP methyl ester carboxylesterase
MDVILIPGFWLGASSWDAIVPSISAAGHRAIPVTLPGLSSEDADRASVTLADQIAAVVALLDASAEPVAIVAHSGGGPIGYAAAAERPGSVARFVFVDTFPLPTGGVINDELPEENGVVALPPMDFWPDAEVAGFTAESWADFAAAAVPEPAQVAAGEFTLASDAARSVPTTLIATAYPEKEIREFMGSGHPLVGELNAVTDLTFVDLDTGHWPQFTKPAELAAIVVEALGR